jgi:hypothetical protein
VPDASIVSLSREEKGRRRREMECREREIRKATIRMKNKTDK